MSKNYTCLRGLLHLTQHASVARLLKPPMICYNAHYSYIPALWKFNKNARKCVECGLMTRTKKLIDVEAKFQIDESVDPRFLRARPVPYVVVYPPPMTLASGGGSPIFPLVVYQTASLSIWPAVQSFRWNLSTNPGVTMWCICGCS